MSPVPGTPEEFVRAQLEESCHVKHSFSPGTRLARRRARPAHRPAMPALALTVNTSVLTAAANDYGYEQVFARQVEALARPGDVLIALSTSGSSPNVLLAAEAGRARGAWVAALTGELGGALRKRADLLINVPSQDAQRIQEAHITVGHILCALVEQHLKSPTL